MDDVVFHTTKVLSNRLVFSENSHIDYQSFILSFSYIEYIAPNYVIAILKSLTSSCNVPSYLNIELFPVVLKPSPELLTVA